MRSSISVWPSLGWRNRGGDRGRVGSRKWQGPGGLNSFLAVALPDGGLFLVVLGVSLGPQTARVRPPRTPQDENEGENRTERRGHPMLSALPAWHHPPSLPLPSLARPTESG